uniref:MICOS complex subunit MIC10 n=1 Tax=Ditylenchus dipsaci TaxID=166011 RepID=A0A915CPP7_9BILA
MSNLSENELNNKIDRCLADTLLKVGGGLAVGIVASAAIFKGRTFPIWLGTGIGIGMGWSNFNHDLNEPYRLHGKKVKVGSEGGKPAYQITIENGSSVSKSNA